MAGLSRRSGSDRNTNIWPGFVDVLATLLMVMMFLLLIFVLAQFFLSEALSGREQALDKLKIQVGELAGMLSLEKKSKAELQLNLSQISAELVSSVALRDELKTSITLLRKNAIVTSEVIDKLQSEAESAREKITNMNTRITAASAESFELRLKLAEAENLSKEQNTKITRMSHEAQSSEASLAEAEEASRALIQKIASLDHQIILLDALKKEMENKISELAGRLNENRKTLLTEKEFSTSARAEVALLNQQMSALRVQLAQIRTILEISEAEAKKKNVQIVNLGKRLNAALASKVQELSRHRSEFFGRLRDLLGKHQGVRIVGDRFVFQSEVFFAKSEAEIAAAGQAQLDQLATTLLEIALEIPGEIDWILRIDGHTDNDPISTSRYPSNWELSTARAISVVRYLINAGLPANRLVAAGFGEFHPIDKRNDEISQRRNRRIELKLTQR
ncbi:MAG: peptidoglycan -binding protein [Rhodospirillales bacterium]